MILITQYTRETYEFSDEQEVSGRTDGLFTVSRATSLKLKLVNIVKDDPKAPFLLATKPTSRGLCYFCPWIAPLYSWSVPNNAEC